MSQSALPRFGIFNTEARVIHSECVGQDYEVGVWLPFSYASTEHMYPVLYVPDGEFAFPAVMGLMPTLMGNGEVPEMIVVGIAYHGISTWAEFGDLRDRDFTPQATLDQEKRDPPRISRQAQYIKFLRQELLPLIEREYRASAEDRALFGFSSAGFFSCHTMLNHPGMFRRHVAASCTWGAASLLESARRYAQQPGRPAVDLFLAVGELEHESLTGFHELVKTLQAFPEVRLSSQIMEGEAHSAGMIAKTFLYGTKAVFTP